MAEAVFINCPFDSGYNNKFRAIVFTIIYCNFEPRSALEVDDATETRLTKIIRIIGECRLSIHDISRTEPDANTRLPRFNMPFELGIVFGAKSFGGRSHTSKSCLVLDTTQFRYRKFFSDIAGQDVGAHRNNIGQLVTLVRNWLSQHRKTVLLPGEKLITKDFQRFAKAFPRICRDAGIRREQILYNDFVNIMKIWIAKEGVA